jgi:hypothetical protein
LHVGKDGNVLHEGLFQYNDYPYKEFHKYISKKLIAFYYCFDPAEGKEELAEPKEGDVVEVGDLPNGSIVQPAYDMSGSSDEEAAGGPKPGPGTAGPAAATAAEAAAASPGAAPSAPASE